MSTVRGSIVQHKQGIQVIWYQVILYNFQYFWDFNKCPQAIFSKLSFENFWLYLLGARLFWLKIIENCCKSFLKVCELNVWVKYAPDVFQNVNTVQKIKPNLQFQTFCVLVNTFQTCSADCTEGFCSSNIPSNF